MALLFRVAILIMQLYIFDHLFMSTQSGGWGDILLLVQIPSASTFISVHYPLNQLIDFDQTYIDTLLGEGEDLKRFWLP